MTKFKIGDHVRIIATSRWFDAVGTVVAIHEDLRYPFHVSGIEDVPLWFHPDELILAEPPGGAA